ncbi:MAG: tetratricopeptide repeat protein, partial [Pseudomonadota bacterium]
FVASATEGMGEVLFTIALALETESEPDLLLIYTRLAHRLAPRNIDALLLTALFLEQLGNPDLATDAYDAVPRTHPAYLRAELGRAAALETAGRADAAVEVLAQLSETHPDIRRVQMSLGDLLRRQEDYARAQRVYDRVINAVSAPQSDDWFAFFARAVTFERQDIWPQAEADFRMSLNLNPNQPMVLNYLGYSFVDRGENLEEARDLIQRAVDAAPDRGYIIDSLGWVMFQLGDYENAVIQLEDAISKMPTDPVVNDHLGDAYWMVGRRTEARFQWRRAQSFDPEPDVADRIARKLADGLDVVNSENSPDATQVADDQ